MLVSISATVEVGQVCLVNRNGTEYQGCTSLQMEMIDSHNLINVGENVKKICPFKGPIVCKIHFTSVLIATNNL